MTRPPRSRWALADTLADYGWLGAVEWDDAWRATRTIVSARLSALAGTPRVS